jgi:hypothetical protein
MTIKSTMMQNWVVKVMKMSDNAFLHTINMDADNATNALYEVIRYATLALEEIEQADPPTGAIATIKWASDGEIREGYVISFGEYDEVSGTDGFGRNDHNIFFYMKDEEELISFKNPDADDPFRVINYELLY